MAEDLAATYRKELLENVVPFWLEHSLDRECGGYLHHLDRDGSCFCTDKMMWMELREVWMFSRLYRGLDARADWLDAARLGAEFLRDHGRDGNGDWYFLLDRQGEPLTAAYNIFSDLFAVLAYLEYGRASGQSWALDLARETFGRVLQREKDPKGRYEKRLPAARGGIEHAFPMIMFSVARDLSETFGENEYGPLAEKHLDVILRKLVDPETGLLYEFAAPDGSRPDGPAGRLVTPGHAIESAWFILEHARATHDDDLARTAARILRAALDIGWDGEHGGIFYFVDVEGRPPMQLEWSMKLWWPHTEALYALLLAHGMTGDEGLKSWHGRVHDYCWANFRDPGHGEWYGYLDRRGEPTHLLKGGRWKGFFHLPRALLNCVLLSGGPTGASE